MKNIKLMVRLLLLSYFLIIGRLLFYKAGGIDRQTFYQEPVVNLVPFSSICNYVWEAWTYGGSYLLKAAGLIGGNLFLLLPWGLLAPVAFGAFRRPGRLALSGFLLSLSAELIQYLFRLGVLELDDIMLNSLGAVMGFYLYRQLHRKKLAWIPARE